jgi:hypothetical protein
MNGKLRSVPLKSKVRMEESWKPKVALITPFGYGTQSQEVKFAGLIGTQSG